MADKPCEECQDYDPILRGKGVKGAHGWCIVRSKYPAMEQRGQTFPPGAARVAPGALAEPYIVRGDGVVTHCSLFKIRLQPPPAPRVPKPAPSPTRRGGR